MKQKTTYDSNGEMTYLNGDAVEETARIENSFGCTAITVRILDGERKNEERVVMVKTETLDSETVEIGTEEAEASPVDLLASVRNGDYGAVLSEWGQEGFDYETGQETFDIFASVERGGKIVVLRIDLTTVEYQTSRGNWRKAYPGTN